MVFIVDFEQVYASRMSFVIGTLILPVTSRLDENAVCSQKTELSGVYERIKFNFGLMYDITEE